MLQSQQARPSGLGKARQSATPSLSLSSCRPIGQIPTCLPRKQSFCGSRSTSSTAAHAYGRSVQRMQALQLCTWHINWLRRQFRDRAMGCQQYARGGALSLLEQRLHSSKAPLDWQGLLQLLQSAASESPAPQASAYLNYLVCQRVDALCSLRLCTPREALPLLVLTSLLSIRLGSKSGLLRKVVAQLDCSRTPVTLPLADRVAILTAIAWHSTYDGACGVESKGGRKAWLVTVLGSSACDNWRQEAADTSTPVLQNLLCTLKTIEGLEWPELPKMIASGELDLGPICQLMNGILDQMNRQQGKRAAKFQASMTSTAAAATAASETGVQEMGSDGLPGSAPHDSTRHDVADAIQAVLLLLRWHVQAHSNAQLNPDTAQDTKRVKIPGPMWQAIRRVVCEYVGWGSSSKTERHVGGLQEGVGLMRALLAQDDPDLQPEPALLNKLLDTVAEHLSKDGSNSPTSLLIVSRLVVELDAAGLLATTTNLLAALQQQAAKLTHQLPPADLVLVVDALRLAQQEQQEQQKRHGLLNSTKSPMSSLELNLQQSILGTVLHQASKAAVASYHNYNAPQIETSLPGASELLTTEQFARLVVMVSELDLLAVCNSQKSGYAASAGAMLKWVKDMQMACTALGRYGSSGDANNGDSIGQLRAAEKILEQAADRLQALTAVNHDDADVLDSELSITAVPNIIPNRYQSAHDTCEDPWLQPSYQLFDRDTTEQVVEGQPDGSPAPSDISTRATAGRPAPLSDVATPTPEPTAVGTSTALPAFAGYGFGVTYVADSLCTRFGLSAADGAQLLESFTPQDIKTAMMDFTVQSYKPQSGDSVVEGPVCLTSRGLANTMLSAVKAVHGEHSGQSPPGTTVTDKVATKLAKVQAFGAARQLLTIPSHLIASHELLAITWSAAVLKLDLGDEWLATALNIVAGLPQALDATHDSLLVWSLAELQQVRSQNTLLQLAGGASHYEQLVQDVLLELNGTDENDQEFSDTDQDTADVFITAEGEEVADRVSNSNESKGLKPLEGLDLPAVAVTLWCLQSAGCTPDKAWLTAAAEYVQDILIDASFDRYKNLTDSSRHTTANDAKMAVSALLQLGVEQHDTDLAAGLLYWVHKVSE